MDDQHKIKRIAEIDFKLSVYTQNEPTSFRRVNGETILHITEASSNGTTCVLTQQPRQTEVNVIKNKRIINIKYMCPPVGHEKSEFIASIEEGATCEYKVIVYTPRLCSLPHFLNVNK